MRAPLWRAANSEGFDGERRNRRGKPGSIGELHGGLANQVNAGGANGSESTAPAGYALGACIQLKTVRHASTILLSQRQRREISACS